MAVTGGRPRHREVSEEIRYRIATGAFAPGERLPSLKDLARMLGVHFHTVRKVCLALQEEGVLEVRQGSGTYVSASPRRGGGRRALNDLVAAAIKRAIGRGFTVEDFLDAAAERAGSLRRKAGRETIFVECNREQAEGHGREIAAATGRNVRPVLLKEIAKGKKGLRMVTTYFHYHELKERCPGADIFPVVVRPDGGVLARVGRFGAGDRLALLCRDQESVRSVQAQLRASAAPRARVRGYSVSTLRAMKRRLGEFRAILYMPPCRRHVAALENGNIEKIELVHRIEPSSLTEVKKWLSQ